MTKYAFVSAEQGNHAVATLCRVIGVSVSGFYAWLRAIPTLQSKAEAEAELRGHIGRIFAARRRAYGSPRVHAELRRDGRRHSRRRIARLMREMGLTARQGRRRTPRTTDSRHDLPIAPNLLDRLPAKSAALARSWLLAHLILALLIEDTARTLLDLPPWADAPTIHLTLARHADPA